MRFTCELAHEKEIENYFSTVKSLDEEQKSLRCIEDWLLDEDQKLNQSHLENFLWEALSAQGIFKCDQLEDFLDNSLKNFLPKPLETALISKIQASDAQNAEIFLTLARIYHHFQGNDHVRAAIFDKIHSEQSIIIALSQLVEMKAAIENFPQKMKLGPENKTAVLSCLDDTYRYFDHPEWVALQLDILFQQYLEHQFYILLNFTYFQALIFLDLTGLDKDVLFLYILLVLSTIFLPVLTAFCLILEIILHLHILISVSRILLYPLMASQLTIQRTDVVKESYVTSFLESFIDIKKNDQNREPLPLWAKKWLIAQSIVRLENIKGLSDEEKLQLRG